MLSKLPKQKQFIVTIIIMDIHKETDLYNLTALLILSTFFYPPKSNSTMSTTSSFPLNITRKCLGWILRSLETYYKTQRSIFHLLHSLEDRLLFKCHTCQRIFYASFTLTCTLLSSPSIHILPMSFISAILSIQHALLLFCLDSPRPSQLIFTFSLIDFPDFLELVLTTSVELMPQYFNDFRVNL